MSLPGITVFHENLEIQIRFDLYFEFQREHYSQSSIEDGAPVMWQKSEDLHFNDLSRNHSRCHSRSNHP